MREKNYMGAYYKIVAIILEVYSGKNLDTALNNLIRDEHFAKIKNHCFGVIRNYYSINYIIDNLVTRKIKNQILNIILQIAIYEINFSQKPIYAISTLR